MKSKGLGDTIEKFTKATGIKTLTEAVVKLTGLPGCGCEERKQYLNELFPYESSTKKIRFIENVEINDVKYPKGTITEVKKGDNIYPVIIRLAQDKRIEEI